MGALVPPGWLSGLEERRSSVLEFWRWKSEVEAVEGEGRVGLRVAPGVALCCGLRPNGAGEGGAGKGDGEGEGHRTLGGTEGAPGVG